MPAINKDFEDYSSQDQGDKKKKKKEKKPKVMQKYAKSLELEEKENLRK